MSRSRGLPPIARRDARALVLGTLPSTASIAARRYYAHPRNAFWPIMGELFGARVALPYAARTRRLTAAGVAVWDVLAVAVRPGSLDAAIVRGSARANDLARFLRTHPGIRHVFFNGANAAMLFRRLVRPQLPPELAAIPTVTLPSTSPAHASLGFRAKLGRWRRLRRALG